MVSPSSSSGGLRRGDVVTIHFPFTDLTNSKLRPAIYISNPGFFSQGDGHFMFIGSQTPAQGTEVVRIDKGSREAVEMGLKFELGKTESYIHPWKIATLEVALVHRKLGRVPHNLLSKLSATLSKALGL